MERAQKLPPGAPRIANPRSRTGVAVMNSVLRVAAGLAAERLGGLASRLFSPPAEAITLPAYPTPTPESRSAA